MPIASTDQYESSDLGGEIVTLYSVNGLHGGNTNWLGVLLPDFTDKTGINVRYVEDHSRNIVDLLNREKGHARADVVITLPPFIHMAAQGGLLEYYKPVAADHLAPIDDKFMYNVLIKNYPNIIYNKSMLKPPVAYTDLLASNFVHKVQYSKPGWSGAGTALLLQVFHAFGGKKGGLEFLRKLQANCLYPCDHTSGLEVMVNNGELLVANGDVQTNVAQCVDNPNIQILFPAAPDGKKYVFEFSYYVSLAKGAPNDANGRALIEYLLGKEAQKKVSLIAQGLPAHNDIVPNDEKFARLTAMLEDVELWKPDWNRIASVLDEDVAAYDKAVLHA